MNCTKCELSKTVMRHGCIPYSGKGEAKLLIVGDVPSTTDDLNNKPFTSKTGNLLRHVMESLSINQDEVAYTLALRCRPSEGKSPRPNQCKQYFESCSEHFQKDWKNKKTLKCILVLGSATLKCFCGKDNIGVWEGMECGNWFGVSIVVGHHPGSILFQANKEIRLAQALIVACDIAGISWKPKDIGMFPYEVRG